MAENDFPRIQIHHEYLSTSNPYPPKLENAMLQLNLPIMGWTNKYEREGIIRHETGPEIVLLASSLVTLATQIVNW
jgi:hypothetical protein